MTTVVNVRREPCDVYIGRGSLFGNPFTHLPLEQTHAEFQVLSRFDSIEAYMMWLTADPAIFVSFPDLLTSNWENRRAAILRSLPSLAGKRLGCYCKPKTCHGDILVALIESSTSTTPTTARPPCPPA